MQQLCKAFALFAAGLAVSAGVASAEGPKRPALSDMDSNGDGKVTVAEFDAAFAKGPQGHGAPDGKAPPAGKPPKGAPPERPTGAKLDTNGDGVISQAEFDAMPKPPAP